MTVNDIIKRFDGLTAFAAAIGAPVSTAHSWDKANYIPAWRQPKVLDAALALGIDLSPTDFPSPDERVSRPVAA